MPPPLPPDHALGLAIKELREARGLTQEELASRADTTIGTISRVEAAKSAPAWATVMQIIDAMDVSLPELAQAVETARRRP
ncbi:MAG TPA: helix-turn-helix transcriptional regulator [Solirubrobacteraceae bacterium]|jgi:transcriptional regulator with XRE-family HTH domain|nr:helix-turn-helix transcriptional regulator [Solirubrobacteraceae bacterium]